MLGLILAALIGVQPAEANGNHHGHHARAHQHHVRTPRPQPVANQRWVWTVGHWVRRPHGLVWARGHWDLRPVPRHAHNKRHHHRY